MGSCPRFDETLPVKSMLYINLTMETITVADYKHRRQVWEDFGIDVLGMYHDLYVQSKTLLPADVFKSLCNKYIKLVDSAHFLSMARLEWQALLKETEVELEPLADMY